mgnify:CR=1 FL=1
MNTGNFAHASQPGDTAADQSSDEHGAVYVDTSELRSSLTGANSAHLQPKWCALDDDVNDHHHHQSDDKTDVQA